MLQSCTGLLRDKSCLAADLAAGQMTEGRAEQRGRTDPNGELALPDFGSEHLGGHGGQNGGCHAVMQG